MIKWIIVEYIATLFQCYVSTDFVTRYLGFKNKDKKNILWFLLAFLVQVTATVVMNHITTYEGFAGIIYPAIVVVYGIFFLKGSIYEKVIIASIDVVLKIITSMSVINLISYLSPLEMNALLVQQGIERFFVLIISMSTYFFLTRVLLRLQRNNKFSLTFLEWVAILSVFITSFFTGVLLFEILLTSPDTHTNSLYGISIIGGLILINALCYYIFVNISIKNKEKLEYTLTELKLQEQEKSLLEMKQSYEEIRKIRHDMKNYLECAATLLYNGKEKEAQNYLNCLLEDKLSVGNQIVFTKSDAINAVLSSKFSVCEKESIKFHYEITGGVELIPEIELSILLANLIDNAIEASLKIKDEREIFLEMYNEKNYLVILVSNMIKESVLTNNPNLTTTKKDKLRHGIGSLSINDIVEKHNGMISRYEKNSRFYVDIWLNLEKVG